jgi:trehalose-6-phosphate synthase
MNAAKVDLPPDWVRYRILKKRNGLAGREFFRITRRKKKRFGRVYCLRIFIRFFFLKIKYVTYYEGYSNSMIWPLCHYFYTYIQYETKFWESYQEVNQLFCDEAVKIHKPGDMVWIQDYQLMLLPAMLREKIEGISIGYFHHIPFPFVRTVSCFARACRNIKRAAGR